MRLPRLAAAFALSVAAIGTPALGAPAGCPRIVDISGDASYGSLGKGTSDLDLHEIHIASGPRTVVLAVRLASLAGTAPELRIGSRVDVRISLEPIDYFLAARRAGDGTWRYTMTGVRIGADGRPSEVPARTVGGRVDAAAAEVVFMVNRSDFADRPDGRLIRLLSGRTYLGADASVMEVDRVDDTVAYRDRAPGCRSAA